MVVTDRRPDPIRVLYIARAPFVSGAERALMSMLRHLDRSLIEPALALGCESELTEQAIDLKIPVTILPLPKRSRHKPLSWWDSKRQLSKLISNFQPHIMHANDVPSCQAMSVVGGKLKIPRIVHIRWGITAADAGWWTTEGVELVLCISQWIKDELGNCSNTSLATADVQIIHDAVDWPANTPEQKTIVQDTPSPQTTITLGFAGQLIEPKGLDLVIQAMGKLPTESQPGLLVAGKDTQTGGRYQAELESLAAKCGVTKQIQWLGFVQDVADVYRQVDAVVCPSRVEPLGLVPLEAAQYNIPCIANRVGGLAETIDHGQTGLLVEPTVDAWAKSLSELPQHDQLQTLGCAARAKTIDGYSPRVYQERLMAFYDHLARPTQEQTKDQHLHHQVAE